MSSPLICHCLIGPPGCGKSTLATQMVAAGMADRIVSTDQIRQQLFGGASIQTGWAQVEAAVIQQVQDAIASRQSIVYDATNARRTWRMDFLRKVPQSPEVQWIGWQLQVPLHRCVERNQQRDRQVEPQVIEIACQTLQQFPPIAAEGFAAVYPVAETAEGFDLQQMATRLKKLSRTLVNRDNRNRGLILHRYSALLDFDRLLHLIVLLINHPGLGNWHESDPQALQSLLHEAPWPIDALSEICAVMRQVVHPLYADAAAIALDLEWLEQNGLIGTPVDPAKLEIPPYAGDPATLIPHTYTDWEVFQRLLKTIRFIVHHPFSYDADKGSLKSLLDGLTQAGGYNPALPTLRKDIEEVLKPYRILPDSPMKRGYCIGTALLSKNDLIRVFQLLQSQSKILHDPIDWLIYDKFRDRLLNYTRFCGADDAPQVSGDDIYPVRAIRNQMIVDVSNLPAHALARNLERLENAIETGELLELNRIPGGGRFTGDEKD